MSGTEEQIKIMELEKNNKLLSIKIERMHKEIEHWMDKCSRLKGSKTEIRKEIIGFAEAMERVMSQHDSNKGDSWKELSFKTLQALMLKEVEETKPSNAKIVEWVDVANLCMMIHHNTMHKTNIKEEPYRICYGDNKTKVLDK